MSGPTGGNRQDNRQRGNAAQLLEKYKSMARDAQLAGDRVQTEYFLQYADHYFRVLEEGRSRFEEQQQSQSQRRRRDDEDDFDGDDEMSADDSGDGEEEGEVETRQRPQRRERAERPQRERFAGDRGSTERSDRPERPRRESANGNRPGGEGDGEERIALGVLPPSIGASDEAEGDAPKPRRRTRKPREDNGDEVAPAA